MRSSTHAGISAFELQTAANLRIPGVTGTNDAVDAITVQIGIDLRAQYAPDELTPSIVSAAMLARLDDMCLDDYHIHYFDSFVDGFGPAPEEGFGVLCDPASPNPPRACGALDDEFAAERDLVRVSAGPNVSGNVDAAIALRGSAEPAPESVSWRYTAGQNVPAGASCSFSDSAALQTEIRCDRPGTYVATVAARYGDQNISDSAVVWVRNVAPRVTLVSPAPWRVFERGRKLTLEGSIADSAYDSHDCTVDWDDGSSAESFAAAGERCLRAHVFDKPGMYSLRLRVTDSAGARDDESVLVIVTDDDDAGSLRVDGESYVAAGAAGAEVASLARLEASATVERHGPSGTLKFDAGALRLRAKEPDWFLVTEDGRSAVAGQGRIDGVGDVGFLLLAEQGCEAHGAGHRGRGGRHSCAEPTPHAARTVIWRLIDGAYPSPQTPRVFDSAVGTNYDIDEALLSPLASGDVDVEPGRSQH